VFNVGVILALITSAVGPIINNRINSNTDNMRLLDFISQRPLPLCSGILATTILYLYKSVQYFIFYIKYTYFNILLTLLDMANFNFSGRSRWSSFWSRWLLPFMFTIKQMQKTIRERPNPARQI